MINNVKTRLKDLEKNGYPLKREQYIVKNPAREKSLIKKYETLKKFQDVIITYDFGDRTETLDIGKIRVDFESSYEESGPFGAKSIGELVIDTPCPALAEAIYNATGVRFRELPITPEKIAMGILKKKGTNENS